MGYLDLADRTWPLLRRAMGLHTFAYRVTGGRIGQHVPGVRAPMLLLDHVGAKSGKKRTVPLLYIPDGDSVAIIASKGGFTKHPAWFHNLRANPETTVQIGRERREVRARVAEGAERERLWDRAVALWPQYADYQARTEREIPVIVLEPRSGLTDGEAETGVAMTDHHTEEHAADDPGQAAEAPSENPEENTAPPSNPEPDPERLEQAGEDADRTIPS